MATQCTAIAKSTGEQCERWAIAGGTTCRVHGSGTKASKASKAAAKRRKAEAAARAATATFGLPVEVDPQAALLAELHRTAGAVAWLDSIVQGLERDDVTWGKTREKTGGDDHGTTHEAGVNVWVQLWQSERKHLAAVARECLKSGIEERRVQLAEDQGRLLAGVVQRILARLDLTTAQQALVGQVVPEEFRAIAALEAS